MRHRSSLPLRFVRLGAVVSVAGALAVVPANASPQSSVWQPPASHVVMLNPPFSLADVKRAPMDYAPLDGSSAVFVDTKPGTETVLHILDTMFPGMSAGLPADQVAVLAETKASPDSSVSVIGKTPAPRLTDVGLLHDLPGVNGDVCPDEYQCAYFLYTMKAHKPNNQFNWVVETYHDTWIYEDDGGIPTIEQNLFVFKSSQNENWAGSFFRDGYTNKNLGSGEGPAGVWAFNVESYAKGTVPTFDSGIIGIPTFRTSTNITSGSCNNFTQLYANGPARWTKAAVVQDTWGFSGWNTNPMDDRSPTYSYAQTVLMSCDQLQYL